MTTSDPALRGLNLGFSYWGNVPTPTSQQTENTLQVRPGTSGDRWIYRDGIFIHPEDTQELSIFTKFFDSTVFSDEEDAGELLLLTMQDNAITEIGFEFATWRVDNDELQYDRRGRIQLDRVNGSDIEDVVILNSYTPIDLSSGVLSVDIVDEGGPSIEFTQLGIGSWDFGSLGSFVTESRIWLKVTEV